MHQDCEKILYSEQEIREKINEIAAKLDGDYAGKRPLLVGVLKGSFIFFADLVRAMNIDLDTEFMAVSSYGSGTTSSGIVRFKKDLDVSIEGRDVILVEDIVDTGFTLKHLKELLYLRHPNSIKIAALLNKPDRRKVELEPDYKCFDCPDEFVIGFGLDYDEKYRNLPYIGVLKESVFKK